MIYTQLRAIYMKYSYNVDVKKWTELKVTSISSRTTLKHLVHNSAAQNTYRNSN
jgi:hypothetical protein